MANARPKIPCQIKNMKRSELEYYITEANLGKEDTKIAIMYLIDKMPQIDIAIELDITQKTVSSRCQKIIEKISEIIQDDVQDKKEVSYKSAIYFPKNTYKTSVNL